MHTRTRTGKQCKDCGQLFDHSDMYTWYTHGVLKIGARCVPCQTEWAKHRRIGLPDGQTPEHIVEICEDLLERYGLTAERVRSLRRRHALEAYKQEISKWL